MMTSSPTEFNYASEDPPDGALFVAADEPLLVFPSVAAAEQYLEAIDVENGVYPAAYGPNGEPYGIGSSGQSVVIQRTGEQDKPEELKALLARYLEGFGRPAEAAASLESLVAEVWKIESEFWREHDPYGERFGSRIPVWGCAAFSLVLLAAVYLVFW